MDIQCKVCGRMKHYPPAAIKKGSGKYCSMPCQRKGREYLPNKGTWVKGQKAWNKGKSNFWVIGEKNNEWKGDLVGVSGIHEWVKKHLGKASNYNCYICRIKQATEWSNISYLYKREFSDWEPLCHKCHMHKDMQNGWGLRKKIFDINGHRISSLPML